MPIDALVHNDLECYVKEGFGGKRISQWPVWTFYRRYVEGDVEGAREAYQSWYADQFSRYRAVPKAIGGMHNGSLFREVVRIHERAGSAWVDGSPAFEQSLIEEAIEFRVRQRFELLKSIQRSGFIPSTRDPVEAVAGNDRIVLKGGHHRVAALDVLDEPVVPRLVVYPQAFWSVAATREKRAATRDGVLN